RPAGRLRGCDRRARGRRARRHLRVARVRARRGGRRGDCRRGRPERPVQHHHGHDPRRQGPDRGCPRRFLHPPRPLRGGAGLRRRRGRDRERRRLGARARPRVPRGTALRCRADRPRPARARTSPGRGDGAGMSSALAETRTAVVEAGRAARSAWRRSYTLATVVAVLALLLPWWAPGFVEIDTLAGWGYLALAAEGLWIPAGRAGMPALGQGAFMGIGAFTTALLTARSGWPAEATVPIATAVALAAGLGIGAAVVRLPRLYIAVSTWILTWLVVAVATEFPGI